MLQNLVKSGLFSPEQIHIISVNKMFKTLFVVIGDPYPVSLEDLGILLGDFKTKTTKIFQLYNALSF